MFSKSTALLGILVLIAVVPALAGEPVRFTAPFDFQVGAKHLSAGTYKVQYPTPNTILVQNQESHEAAMILTNSMTPANAEKGKIVFVRYGDVSFLHKVVPPSGSGACEVLKTRPQRDVERAYAERAKSREMVALKLSR